MKESKLFVALPDYVATPDSMAIDAQGNLILSCPNFANPALPGVVLKIDKNRNITKWFDVPIRPDTGCARPMGIAFGPDGDLYMCDNQSWSEAPELLFKGRLLRLRVQPDGTIEKWTVVANNVEHPNGIRIKDGYVYMTNSKLTKVKDPSGKLVSCVYRFGLDEENIQMTSTLDDPHILCTYLTHNPADQYGVDGIEFDLEGNLLIGNFGDGAVYKVTFHEDGSVKSNEVWAQNPQELESTDGMILDKEGNLYIADFCANAIVKVSPDGKTVERLAQSPDCTGLEGGLDQPGEPILWEGRIIAACFDTVVNDIVRNTAHELPATLAEIEL